MTESGRQDILLMAILVVTKNDVMAGADELGIPEEQVTDDVIEQVKRKVSQSLSDWREAWLEVVKNMVKDAIKCPLGLVCSPSCVWREVGQCISPRGVE